MRRRRSYYTYTTEVDVDIDLEEVLDDLSDDELAEHGLMRIPEGVTPVEERSGLSHGLASPYLTEHLSLVRGDAS